MALHPSGDPAPGASPGTSDEAVLHNPVLLRTREPASSKGRWVMPTLLGAAIVLGAAVLGFVATHPGPPVVNHAVASTPAS